MRVPSALTDHARMPTHALLSGARWVRDGCTDAVSASPRPSPTRSRRALRMEEASDEAEPSSIEEGSITSDLFAHRVVNPHRLATLEHDDER
jgi:hypothetical protein